MGKIFTADDLSVFQQSFRVLSVNKFYDDYFIGVLLFLEIGKQQQPLMSCGSISKQESWQMSIKTLSKLFSGISFGIPDNSILLCWLYCSDMA